MVRFKLAYVVPLFAAGSFLGLPAFSQPTLKAVKARADSTQPAYKRASYAGESLELKNAQLQLRLFKRLGGWGWGEISTPAGKLMAVLDHLGEILLRDQDIPMRLEAYSVQRQTDSLGESLIFTVKAVVVQNKLKGTSFDEWMHYPLTAPCLTGTVTIRLVKNKPLLNLQYRLRATGNYYARYIRGPWLNVGEASFGSQKDDALFPGVDWVMGDEWSSGTDFFKNPWALRSVSHPNKVTAPLMAVSHQNSGIGLSWNPTQTATRWFNYRAHHPQPVFAAPNFIDRMNNTVMGLMIPDASTEGHENETVAAQPLELHIDQPINFDADIWLSEGNSMQVMTDWVVRHGLPKPPPPKWSFAETLDRIAGAYNTNLWREGEGFGIKQRPEDKIKPRVPAFLERYVSETTNKTVAAELRKKLDWCRSKQEPKPTDALAVKHLREEGDKLLAIQRADGSFFFDPDGRHYRKDDFKVATSFIEPMGLAYDTALDITMLPALQLLEMGQKTGNEAYKKAARKALDYCLPMRRPEGGDFWETPLHAPNLLAAGHAAVAYYEAYKTFGDARYKEQAIYWLRCLLPFTHLWQPDDMPMLYNTKPCLSSSDWYFANWVRDHVQWEVLSVFALSAQHGIRWHKVDPAIDWLRFQEGITVAAIRWMNVHTDNTWRPHNIPDTWAAYERGDFDYCFPDTHNSTTGNYGGMFIMPEPIAINIYALMDNRTTNSKNK